MKVYIVGGDWLIARMFIERGHTIVTNTDEADLIQFTGGSDVDPSYYQEERHARTRSNPERDAYEANIFLQQRGKPLAGICRGGQFLNVMSGGSMYQDVDGHLGTHYALNTIGFYPDEEIKNLEVTSTHHQMMRPSDDAEWVLFADTSRRRETADKVFTGHQVDAEVLYYPNTNSLCFQPHPEYVPDDHPCRDFYFECLEKYLRV